MEKRIDFETPTQRIAQEVDVRPRMVRLLSEFARRIAEVTMKKASF